MNDFYTTSSAYLAAILALIILAIMWEPSRRAIGLVLIISGAAAAFTGVGCCGGLPTIFFGALLLFWK